MTRSLCHIVAAADAGARLDALMAERGLYPSRSAAARAIEEGAVFVTGANVAKKLAVAAGATVVYEAAEEAAPRALEGEPIDLDIRFEDEHLLVLSKQVGLVCHPSVDHYDGTLVNALVHHCGAANLCNVQGEDDRLGIVHRLDRDTSGLMLAAKTDEAGYALMEDIRARAVDRRGDDVPRAGALRARAARRWLLAHRLQAVHRTHAPDPRAYGVCEAPAGRRAGLPLTRP